jgi:hypothetical protein
VRSALILLVIVALVLAVAGAINHSEAFDLDYVAGTWVAVSLFWAALLVAGLLLVVGGIAAMLAGSSARRTVAKLEIELQSTYERLRAAKSQVPPPAPDAPTTIAEAPAVTVLAGAEDATAVSPSAAAAEVTAVTPLAPETGDVTAVVRSVPPSESEEGTPPAP